MKYRILLFLTVFSLQSNLIAQSAGSDPIHIGEQFTFFSKVLNENRDINIYEPKELWGMDAETENLPVVYVLDGESQFVNTVATIDFLSGATNGNDVLPRSLIVGITNTNRNRDLTPFKGMLGSDTSTLEVTGGGPSFLEFITTELMPFIDNNYATCKHRTLIGHSLGGLLVLDALLNKREYFDNYLVIDPALGFGNNAFFKELLDTLNTADLNAEKVFLAVANNRPSFLSLEDLKNDTMDFMKSIDRPNQEFLNLPESKEWQINMSMKYYKDENHYSVPHPATYDAMRSFFSFYQFKEMFEYSHQNYVDKTDLVLKIKKHYRKISENLGCEFIPMEGYLNSWAFGMEHSRRHDLAIDMHNYKIELYPDRPGVYNSFGYYLRNNNKLKEAIKQFDKSIELMPDDNILEIRNQLYKELREEKGP